MDLCAYERLCADAGEAKIFQHISYQLMQDTYGEKIKDLSVMSKQISVLLQMTKSNLIAHWQHLMTHWQNVMTHWQRLGTKDS